MLVHARPLHAAVLEGDFHLAQQIVLEDREAPHRRDHDGNFPLHLAAGVPEPNPAILDLLVKVSHHAMFEPNDAKDLPLHIAARTGTYEACALLLRAAPDSASLCNKDAMIPAQVAIARACAAVLDPKVDGQAAKKVGDVVDLFLGATRFLDRGAFVRGANANPACPLVHVAAALGSERLLSTVLAHDPVAASRPDVRGTFPAARAAERGHAKCLDALLRSAPQTLSRPVLHAAVANGHEAAVRTALYHDPRLPGRDTLTLAMRTIKDPKAVSNVCALLFAAKPILSLMPLDSSGWTALHYAAALDWVDGVRSVVAMEPLCVTVRTHAGMTPLALAIRNDKTDVARLLVAAPGMPTEQVFEELRANGASAELFQAAVEARGPIPERSVSNVPTPLRGAILAMSSLQTVQTVQTVHTVQPVQTA